MLFLTTLSVPVNAVSRIALATDPLVASDPGYAIKTWLAENPGVALRPWRADPANGAVRITGWRSVKPLLDGIDRSVYVGVREIGLVAGETLSLSCRFVPIRVEGKRVSKFPMADGRPHVRFRRKRDAAKDYAGNGGEDLQERKEAYHAWLRERLLDVAGFAQDQKVTCLVQDVGQVRVLRKGAQNRFGPGGRAGPGRSRGDEVRTISDILLPVAEADIQMVVRDPAGVEAWLLKGVGQEKPFGFGAAVPSVGFSS